MDKPQENTFWMDSGEWAAMTMGEFVSLLVDGGSDAVFARVTENEPSENGSWTMHLDVVLVPHDRVRAFAENVGCTKYHEVLSLAMRRGLVK